jgi:hypothetical protein
LRAQADDAEKRPHKWTQDFLSLDVRLYIEDRQGLTVKQNKELEKTSSADLNGGRNYLMQLKR